MSAVVIAGNTSGSVTLAAPDVAGTTTLTLPATSGTVMVNGATFSASKTTSQSISAATVTKIQYNNEQWDTNNNYDNTSNYRFTPTVAGYYQINASIVLGGGNTGICLASIYKNGSEYKRGTQLQSTATYAVTVSGLVYFNGSTDYVEIFLFAGGATTIDTNGLSYFDGVLVRGA